MKEIVQSKRISPRTLLAFLALSMLLAPNAHAQAKQALTQDNNSSPVQCNYNQLSLRNLGQVTDMGATRYIEFTFTNISSSPCTLKGYPRFEFLNKSGRPAHGGLAANTTDFLGDYGPPQPVTISPGRTASFVVNYLSRYNETRGRPCPTYRKLRVTAPGINRPFVHRLFAVEVCSGLQISPILATPFGVR